MCQTWTEVVEHRLRKPKEQLKLKEEVKAHVDKADVIQSQNSVSGKKKSNTKKSSDVEFRLVLLLLIQNHLFHNNETERYGKGMF